MAWAAVCEPLCLDFEEALCLVIVVGLQMWRSLGCCCCYI